MIVVWHSVGPHPNETTLEEKEGKEEEEEEEEKEKEEEVV